MKQQIVSTEKLKTYQMISLIIWLALLVFLMLLVLNAFEKIETDWFRLYWIGYWGFGFYMLYIRRTLRLKSIAYDHKNIYIIEKGQEIVIPFVEVKEIKLRNVIGTHSVNLYRDLGFGQEFYFKSSLWYPFNYKKIDDQVYDLQKFIDRAKREYQPQNYNALGS